MTHGIIISIIVGILGKILSIYLPSLGSTTLAIACGVIVRNFIFKSNKIDEGTKIIEKKLLPIAIMLLGANLNFSILLDLGFKSIIYICLIVSITITSSYFLAKIFSFDKKFALLLGTGNAVCGSSAIAASSQVLDADEESIGLSIAVVNLMGTIGIFLIPIICSLFQLNDIEAGLVIGGNLQAVGQAVAAGFSVNESVGRIATIIKMGRVLTLGVVILAFELLVNKNSIKSNNKSKINIPYFIVGFFIISIFSSLNIFPETAIKNISKLGKYCLLFSMAAIGLRINFMTLISKGSKLLSFELLIEFVKISTSILLIYLLF